MARATMTVKKTRTIYTKGQYQKQSNQIHCPVCGKFMAKKG